MGADSDEGSVDVEARSEAREKDVPVRSLITLFLPASAKITGKFAIAIRPHLLEKARATLLPA